MMWKSYLTLNYNLSYKPSDYLKKNFTWTGTGNKHFFEVFLIKFFFLMTYIFKVHVQIVKTYIVKFNVTIFNRLKMTGFL